MERKNNKAPSAEAQKKTPKSGRRTTAEQPKGVAKDNMLRQPDGKLVPTQEWGPSHHHQI